MFDRVIAGYGRGLAKMLSHPWLTLKRGIRHALLLNFRYRGWSCGTVSSGRRRRNRHRMPVWRNVSAGGGADNARTRQLPKA